MSVPTRTVTIHRISDAATDVDAFLETLQGTFLDETASSDMALPEYPDAEAVAFHWRHDLGRVAVLARRCPRVVRRPRP